MNKEQGYIDKTNVLLSSKKLKKFKYSEDCLKNCPIDEFDVYVKIQASVFYKYIEFLNKVQANYVNFEIYKSYQRMFRLSYSDVLFETEINLNVLYPIEENAECKYSVEYLINLLKEYKIKDFENDFIELWFSTDYPLKIKFKDDWFILAPRVEVD